MNDRLINWLINWLLFAIQGLPRVTQFLESVLAELQEWKVGIDKLDGLLFIYHKEAITWD